VSSSGVRSLRSLSGSSAWHGITFPRRFAMKSHTDRSPTSPQATISFTRTVLFGMSTLRVSHLRAALEDLGPTTRSTGAVAARRYHRTALPRVHRWASCSLTIDTIDADFDSV